MTAIEMLVMVVYLSILIEITIFPVPSVSSTYQLIFSKKQDLEKGLLQYVKSWHSIIKLLLLLLPTTFSVLVYCLPLLAVFRETMLKGFEQLRLPETGFVVPIALFLMILGRILSFYSVIVIRRNNSQKNNDFSLKTQGIFSFSRNPILIGMYITFIGLFLLFPYKIMLVGLFIYVGNMHFRILLEEDFLYHKFGGQFEAYKNATRRYL